ncbi:NRT2 ribosyltransferase, partial [Anthoscopus minutus]|nr:NRT2 ribosyltransferase [Anthoscopus minutus]
MAALAQSLALLAMAVASMTTEVVPLDMAWSSFDDQYQGCGPAMAAALPALNRSEFQENPMFAQAWVKARAMWQSWGSRLAPLESPGQAIALWAYTMDDPGMYQDFNKAVGKAGSSSQEYRQHFHYKTLHFLLTDAVRTLRAPQCRCVHRGTNKTFEAQLGQRVRFGQFASTSLCRAIALGFSSDTLFQVWTCYGAEIQEFSQYPNKQEVLVPPFETFEVTKIIQQGEKVQIYLNSTGTYSKYNCEWLQGDVLGTSWG